MIRKLQEFAARTKLHMAAAVSVAALCCGLAGTTHALSFDKINNIYFFGDSLTDSGFYNLFPGLPVGKAPTFTTVGGYTWAQYLAHDIKHIALPTFPPGVADLITNNTTPLRGVGPVNPVLTGFDYAAGGSTTGGAGFNLTFAPSLLDQVQQFITSGIPIDPNDVFFIWSGANDLLTVLFSAEPTQLHFLQAANNASINIANAVSLLNSMGAKRFVIMSLPNIGVTPLINAVAVVSSNPTLPASMQTVTFTFNSFLNQQLGNVILQRGIKVLYFDTYLLLDNVIRAIQAGRPVVAGGQTFTFTDFQNPVCGNPITSTAITCTVVPDGQVFADGLHPADMAHRYLSLSVETAIQNWN